MQSAHDEDLKIKGLRRDFPLRNYTTFKIGGPAKYFFEPHSLRDLNIAVSFIKDIRSPVYVLGGGSNLLVSDEGIDGVVLCMKHFEEKHIRRFGNLVRISAGYGLQRLVNQTARWGLSGLEGLAGIPGTLGGAVRMNAGSHIANIGEFVSFVEMMDSSGKIQRVRGSDIMWGYRSAHLDGCVVLYVEMELTRAAPSIVRKKISETYERKRATQPLTRRSAGCFFKNPASHSAGQLLDEAGFKGFVQGGAAISRKHANFIVNRGGASAGDVLALVKMVREKIKQLYNLELESEVAVWPY